MCIFLAISRVALALAFAGGLVLGAAIPRGQRSTDMLNCDSFLRILFPEHFRRCDCEWSEWRVVTNSVVSVSTTACVSGEAYSEVRTRTAGEGCDPLETRRICLPDREDRLILALGLGNQNDGDPSEGNTAMTQPVSETPPTTAPPAIVARSTTPCLAGRNGPNCGSPVCDPECVYGRCVAPGTCECSTGWSGGHCFIPICVPQCVNGLCVSPDRCDCNPGWYGRHCDESVPPQCPVMGADPWICRRFEEPHRRKRSTRKEQFENTVKSPRIRPEIPSPNNIQEIPLPFDWKKHHSRFRRQQQSNQDCLPDGIQHVLFLLDISGSIAESEFEKMKIAISNLTTLFCKPIKVAVLTFSHELKLEFCFNCFESSRQGRVNAIREIYKITYRAGYTHTAGATLCACEELLHPDCGLHPDANCIDVVYVTDGQSNDPTRQVCNEVQCLRNHNRYHNHINTYALGISDYNQAEIECIAHSSSVSSVFQFRDFDDFEFTVRNIIKRLIESHNSNSSSKYDCVNRDETLGHN